MIPRISRAHQYLDQREARVRSSCHPAAGHHGWGMLFGVAGATGIRARAVVAIPVPLLPIPVPLLPIPVPLLPIPVLLLVPAAVPVLVPLPVPTPEVATVLPHGPVAVGTARQAERGAMKPEDSAKALPLVLASPAYTRHHDAPHGRDTGVEILGVVVPFRPAKSNSPCRCSARTCWRYSNGPPTDD